MAVFVSASGTTATSCGAQLVSLLLPDRLGNTADVVLGFATDLAGSLTIATRWPAGVSAGFEFFVQAWVADPGAPGGYAASNALRAEVGS